MSLVLLSPWGVVAQGPKPTATPPRVKLFQRPDRPPSPRPASAGQWNYEKPFPRALAPKSSTGVRSPRISLGQPGLSFRYVQTFGTTEQAYPDPGTNHLNGPTGLFIDSSDNLYVVENTGDRVLRYSSGGTNTLARGTAGLCVTSNNPIGFCSPQDVALDWGGNFWVADDDRVVQFDSSGNFLQQLPPPDSLYSGNDDTHFSWVTGIAFDYIAHRMFVSDGNNQRVQVYTFSGNNPRNSPSHDSTIGTNGSSGGDNNHFNQPYRLAVDSSHRVYVADRNNGRVQRCSYAAGTWPCAQFGPGLNQPQGIAVDSSDNVYIADSNNNQVLKCDSSGTCNTLISNLPSWVPDVAVDSSGKVYVSDNNRAEVRRYNGTTGDLIDTFVGVTNQPYVADTTPATPLLNRPWGIAVASDGSIYVAEDNGNRLVKLNAAGTRQWAVGQAGVWGDDGAHFGYLEGKPAIASNGRIYVPDTGNDRIMIFDANGNLVAPPFGSSGNTAYKFSCPEGIAINPVNGDFYIVDHCNQRVQVFNGNLIYKATLGTTGVSGADATHFNNPYDVAFDSSGNAYIADSDNFRVQKCTLSVSGSTYTYNCTTFLGETGVANPDFGHFGHPLGVAIDSAGRFYVSEEWNNRVQVFDSSGAYLTTIGGAWGKNTGQMRSPSSIAFDSAGNVYVTDRENHRIQKFAIGVPGWVQTNINGFGDVYNRGWMQSGVSGGYLYVGAANFNTGGELWRSSNGTTWTQVNTDGFGDANNTVLIGMADFGGDLYVGTHNETVGGQVWRSADGTHWTQANSNGFGDANNLDAEPRVVLGGYLYVDTTNWATGCEIWRTDGTSWSQVNLGGFGDAHNVACTTQQIFNGSIYIGTYNPTTGGELWGSSNGTGWSQVYTDGFGDANNQDIVPQVEYDGYLYASTFNTSTGVEIWRSANGTTWAQVNADGFGSAQNIEASDFMATVLNNELYVAVENDTDGMQIWKTRDGSTWSQVLKAGFGDSNNISGTMSVFNGRLYIAAANSADANGGEVWQLINQLYLPLIKR